MDPRCQVAGAVDGEASDAIGSALEQLVRDGARLMLERALEADVVECLGRTRYQRGAEFRGYRNGFQRARQVPAGTWSVGVRAPRVADTPAGSPEFD